MKWAFIVKSGDNGEGTSIRAVAETHTGAFRYVVDELLHKMWPNDPEKWTIVERISGIPSRWSHGCDWIEIEKMEMKQ